MHQVAQADMARAASRGGTPARAVEARHADPDNPGRGLAIGLALSAALWGLLIGGYFLLR